jgi:carbonic anhydrase
MVGCRYYQRSEKEVLRFDEFAFILLDCSVCFDPGPDWLARRHGCPGSHPTHWDYEGKEGPKELGNLDSSCAACSMGHMQSPIDIKDARKADLPTLKFDYHAVPLNIIDNGHTIQFNYALGSTLTVGENIYTLKQFSFSPPE